MNVPTEMPIDAPKPVPPGVEQREKSDRRQSPTSPRGCFPLAGRRKRQRRAEEHRQPYFVDRFSSTLLILVLMLLMASLVDALLTLRLIQAGGTEINPLMDRLLSMGVVPFLIGKYILTAIGLPLLVIFKNFYLFGTRFRIGYLFPVLLSLYAVLIGYQLVLMHRAAAF
ncbi:MAG: DUF5658 family protein [Thermoguttaceae bacterium]